MVMVKTFSSRFFFDRQILPGTFEYTLNHLIDNEIDLAVFDNHPIQCKTGKFCVADA